MVVDNITYHKSLITEDRANWSNYNFDEKETKLMSYLKDRDLVNKIGKNLIIIR